MSADIQAETYLDLYYIALKLPLSWEVFEDTALRGFIKVVLVPIICDCLILVFHSLASL